MKRGNLARENERESGLEGGAAMRVKSARNSKQAWRRRVHLTCLLFWENFDGIELFDIPVVIHSYTVYSWRVSRYTNECLNPFPHSTHGVYDVVITGIPLVFSRERCPCSVLTTQELDWSKVNGLIALQSPPGIHKPKVMQRPFIRAIPHADFLPLLSMPVPCRISIPPSPTLAL